MAAIEIEDLDTRSSPAGQVQTGRPLPSVLSGSIVTPPSVASWPARVTVRVLARVAENLIDHAPVTVRAP